MGTESEVWDPPVFAPAPAGTDAIILLVHGYNVRHSKAVAGYAPFRAELGARNRACANSVVTAAWPCWIPGRWGFGFINYPKAVDHAGPCAAHLAAQIRSWFEPGRRPAPPARLIIVAHSMGCRLVVDVLEQLATRPERLRRLDVVLMAAALGKDSSLAPRAAAGGVAHNVHVMHSVHDNILAEGFPIGERRSGHGWQGEAVGLHGEPFAPPARIDMAPHVFRHGSYWKEALTVRMIMTALGLSGLAAPAPRQPESTLPSNTIASSAPPPRIGESDQRSGWIGRLALVECRPLGKMPWIFFRRVRRAMRFVGILGFLQLALAARLARIVGVVGEKEERHDTSEQRRD